MTCLASGTAVAGQYSNIGLVAGTPSVGDDVEATDASHYFGSDPGVIIQKLTNGEDADEPPGPSIAAGLPVDWTYNLTNTGNITLTDVSVTDDQGVLVSCPDDSLTPGQTMTCTATGVAIPGQYANVGTVTGTPPEGPEVSADDPSHYFGLATEPAISIEKRTNGVSADLPPGPFIPIGDPVEWSYLVSNPGNVPLINVSVSDDQGVTVSCPQTELDVGESMTCLASGTAVAGQYGNIGLVAGTPPVGDDVEATDASHYFGTSAAIDVEKLTNGEDADTAPGPEILVGETVVWTYVVANIGDVALTGVTLIDDNGTPGDSSDDYVCPIGDLAVGAVDDTTCIQTATAVAGQYSNTASVEGYDGDRVASDADSSHYYGQTADDQYAVFLPLVIR
jgi:hypothetical protein